MQALTIAANSIDHTLQRFEVEARKTAVAPLQNSQTGSVEAAAARTQVAASLTVTRTADAMMGTLLDTKA